MGSRDDPLVVDEGAATEVVADIDRHLPGLRVGITLVAAHNPVIRRGCSCGVKKKKIIFIIVTILFFLPLNHRTYCRCALPAAPRSVRTIRPIILWLTQAFLRPDWTRKICHSLHLYLNSSVSFRASPSTPPYLHPILPTRPQISIHASWPQSLP